jgi:hypothetical protein
MLIRPWHYTRIGPKELNLEQDVGEGKAEKKENHAHHVEYYSAALNRHVRVEGRKGGGVRERRKEKKRNEGLSTYPQG